jgi:hypothetical protein
MNYTIDQWWRVVFALQAYHASLAQAVNVRHRKNPDDAGLPILRSAMLETDRQANDLQTALTSGRLK